MEGHRHLLRNILVILFLHDDYIHTVAAMANMRLFQWSSGDYPNYVTLISHLYDYFFV